MIAVNNLVAIGQCGSGSFYNANQAQAGMAIPLHRLTSPRCRLRPPLLGR